MSTFRRCTFPIALLVGAALGACGGSLCDRAQSTSSSLQTKFQPCGTVADAGFSQATLNIDKTKCEANLRQCSSSDKDALSRTLDCFDRVQTCAPGAYFQFLAGLVACVPNVSQITPACLQAIQR